ncbi:MAG: hypothetical protein HC897_10430 [Thermoanaerobaculia bacterium]|nr:hypothetical protein [Thermoanaerobaculia bacterium]
MAYQDAPDRTVTAEPDLGSQSEATAIVKSLRGAWRYETEVEEADYRRYLEEKHLATRHLDGRAL